jgi:hypothetical protein
VLTRKAGEAGGRLTDFAALEHFYSFCKADLVVSYPFYKEREMGGARSFRTLSQENALIEFCMRLGQSAIC